MPYQILNSDVTNDDSQNPNDPILIDPGQPRQPPTNYMKIAIILLHITLILGSFFLIYVIFITPFLFEDTNNFKLTGTVDSFSTQLSQPLTIRVEDYNMSMQGGTDFSGEGENFQFSNFTGTLTLNDERFILSGVSPKLTTTTSEINTKQQFIVLTFQKGGVELELDNVTMNISKSLDLTYSPDLIFSTDNPTTIYATQFVGTISYDNLLSLYGNVDEFELENNVTSIKFD